LSETPGNKHVIEVAGVEVGEDALECDQIAVRIRDDPDPHSQTVSERLLRAETYLVEVRSSHMCSRTVVRPGFD